MNNSLFRAAAFLFASIAIPSSPITAQVQPMEHLLIDAKAPTTPFPHFWEQTFGSGRAILSLRESYRDDLRTVKQATNFESIRFHGIFMDEVGLYDPDRKVQNPGLAAQGLCRLGQDDLRLRHPPRRSLRHRGSRLVEV